MDKWIELGIFLAATIGGWIAASNRSKGYTDRQLKGIDEQVKAFWVHINNREIHERSMDAKLIEQMFVNVNQRFNDSQNKMDDLAADVKGARQAVHDLRDAIPQMLITALAAKQKGIGG